MELSNSKIAVIGGAGFIGSHIVDALVKENPTKIMVYDNFTRGKETNLQWATNNGKVEIMKGDICDKDNLKKALKNVDYVFHEAALWLLECEDKPSEALRINIDGTFNVLSACVENDVKKIVFASSSSVYGNGVYFPTDEVHPFNNDLFYGATKIADEQLLRAFYKKYNLPYIGLRYLNVYGPRMDYCSAYVMVIMNFLNKIAQNKPPEIYGDGSATLDLIYVTDVARANILALKSNITNDFFNVASGKETTLKELLDIILKLTGSTLKPIYKPRDEKLVVRRFGCPKKAKELLGFATLVSVKEGIQKVIEWRNEDSID